MLCKTFSYWMLAAVLVLPMALAPKATTQQAAAQEATPRVLVIGIDGCRPDALKSAKTPNIDSLIQAGMLFEGTDIRKPNATDKADTISGPGWSNLLTGVWPDKHNVLGNQFKEPNYERYPHMFAGLKEARPTAVTAARERPTAMVLMSPKSAQHFSSSAANPPSKAHPTNRLGKLTLRPRL